MATVLGATGLRASLALAQDSTSHDTVASAAAGGGASGDSVAHHRSHRRTTASSPHHAQRRPEVMARDSVLDAKWAALRSAPVKGSALLPSHRIVAFYGTPLSKRMGVLGAYPVDSMLARLDREVAAWHAADSTTPVIPALHLIDVVAQGSAGTDGKYRARMPDTLVEKVYAWAQRRNALLFLDIQPGHSTVEAEVPRLAKFLVRPTVHLAIDPEFAMSEGGVPGSRIGTIDASDVNFAIRFLDSLAGDSLPPKILVIHRFRRHMLTHVDKIALSPRVQVVIDMDGFGPPSLKRESYHDYVYRWPVQYTGWKQFYRQDVPHTPIPDILKLVPVPVYIQYQ